ncbi:LrgB family protein [Pontibacterium granulatum]|uniref:LrgB family protein n=1 Tax=Pontibacterium granulatum TaxID=2036029 RepID=UPI00249C0F92|nr:LrgB family protein [Pontibacterium granulatum]MDI3323658.1 LrgB family protein [Pontibacterium granulatum]
MDLWMHFQTSPLVWIIVTILAFMFASWVNKLAGRTPMLHPVVVGLLLIIGVLKLTDTSYDTYKEGAQFISFLLGPAVVALAVPLYDNLARVRAMLIPLLVACIAGALVAALTAIAVGIWLDLSMQTLLSLAPKSVTTPIAIGIADKIGGYPSLTAGLVLITGALGCLMSPYVCKLLRVNDPAVRGFSLGVAAHAMGTAYAFEYGAIAGAFGGLAMGMTGTFTAFMLPPLISLLGLG